MAIRGSYRLAMSLYRGAKFSPPISNSRKFSITPTKTNYIPNEELDKLVQEQRANASPESPPEVEVLADVEKFKAAQSDLKTLEIFLFGNLMQRQTQLHQHWAQLRNKYNYKGAETDDKVVDASENSKPLPIDSELEQQRKKQFVFNPPSYRGGCR